MLNLTSPIVALLTPFNADGTIAWRAFESYLAALSSWGVETLIANGTTGEFPSLTLNERQQIVEFVRQHFAGALINNVSSTCIEDVKRSIARTEGHADAILLLPPYYYAGSCNDGLCAFFKQALADNHCPVFLYNFPKHTGNRIDEELLAMLANQGVHITGIKDSSGDLHNALAYHLRFPELKVFFAADTGCLAALQNGLSGSVTGGANPLLEFMLEIRKHLGKPDDKAQTLQCAFDVWNTYRSANPILEIPLLKAAMGARIRDFPVHVRPPFTPSPADAIGHIRAAVLGCLSALQAILDGERSKATEQCSPSPLKKAHRRRKISVPINPENY